MSAMLETFMGLEMGKPSQKNVKVAANAQGTVYTIRRRLGAGSTLSTLAGTNANLSLSGTSIQAAGPIPSGTSQSAVIREALGLVAIEYPVLITAG